MRAVLNVGLLVWHGLSPDLLTTYVHMTPYVTPLPQHSSNHKPRQKNAWTYVAKGSNAFDPPTQVGKLEYGRIWNTGEDKMGPILIRIYTSLLICYTRTNHV